MHIVMIFQIQSNDFLSHSVVRLEEDLSCAFKLLPKLGYSHYLSS